MANTVGQLNRRTGIFDPKAIPCQGMFVNTGMQVGKTF